MNGRTIGQVVGLALLATVELIATGIILCIGWHLGSKLVNRFEKRQKKKLVSA